MDITNIFIHSDIKVIYNKYIHFSAFKALDTYGWLYIHITNFYSRFHKAIKSIFYDFIFTKLTRCFWKFQQDCEVVGNSQFCFYECLLKFVKFCSMNKIMYYISFHSYKELKESYVIASHIRMYITHLPSSSPSPRSQILSAPSSSNLLST